MGRLNGKTAVITGAGRGIGAVMAKRMASEGANVVVTDVIETDGGSTAHLGEPYGILPGAVGHEDVRRTGCGERLDRTFRHLTGAEHEYGSTAEPIEMGRREGNCSLRDRGDTPPDSGVGSSPLPGLECMTKQRPENRPDGAVFGGLLPGGANLAKDLVLTDNRRVESGRDREEVTYCLGVVQCVEVVGDVFWSKAGVAADELSDVLVSAMEPLGVGVDLDTVAGREHNDFGQMVSRPEIGKRLRDVVGRDRHPLEHGERSRPVVATDGDDRHERGTSGGAQDAGRTEDGRSHP